MKSRPILFSAPMVRAILDGRKTQTRRLVKFLGTPPSTEEARRRYPIGLTIEAGFDGVRCPFGGPGDQLWVKETWAHDGSKAPPIYRADWVCKRDFQGVAREHGPDRWRPSIYMPRWASRLTLEVTGVRVERLQEISEEDARSEGVELVPLIRRWKNYMPERESSMLTLTTARDSFLSLWESINGTESLAANPWVWVVQFRTVTM